MYRSCRWACVIWFTRNSKTMTTQFKPITPGAYLSDQVADVLAAEIRAGRLGVGDKLPTEAALVAQFLVSRTVVREAVSRLKSLGLVDSRQGRRVIFRSLWQIPRRGSRRWCRRCGPLGCCIAD